MNTKSAPSRDESIAMIADLRSKMLSVRLADLKLGGLPEGRRVIGLLMETGYEDAACTLVAMIDGAVSLYFSNGGGMIGAGEHEPVRTAAAGFLDAAEHFSAYAGRTEEAPLPSDGEVTFYFVTEQGLLSYSAAENDLGEERDPFSSLFFSGHAVLSEVRRLDERHEAGNGDA